MIRAVSVLLLAVIPAGLHADVPRVGLANIANGLLACDLTPDGLVVAGFESLHDSAVGPEPGDSCLPLVAMAAAMGQPPEIGQYPVNVAQLRPDPLGLAERGLVWSRHRDGLLVELVTCAWSAANARLDVTGYFAEATVGALLPADPVGTRCVEFLAQRGTAGGVALSGPVPAALNAGFAAASEFTGLVFLLVPPPGATEQAKVVRCDKDALNELRVTCLERGNDSLPDSSAAGQLCLQTLAGEQGPPGSTGGAPRLRLVGPMPVPDIEECLIFDFGSGGLSSQVPSPPPPPPAPAP